MFGNQRGWIFSGVIAVAIGALLVLAIRPHGITPPTGTLTIAMKPATIPADPSTVLPAPTKECDAGDQYRKAIADYTSDQDKYDHWRQKVLEARNASPPAVQLLVDAGDCGKMTLFSKTPQELIGYEDRPALDALNQVGSLCGSIALVYAAESNTAAENHEDAKAKESAEQAERYAKAAFNLGRHMYEERIIFDEWMDGITLMESSAQVIERVEKDATRRDAIKDFVVASEDFRRDKVKRLWEIVSGVGEEDTATYAGDIFEIARHSPDRMWRVEGILKLGRFKYHSATKGNEVGARRELAVMAADASADPVVHTAATAANDMTVEQFRMMK